MVWSVSAAGSTERDLTRPDTRSCVAKSGGAGDAGVMGTAHEPGQAGAVIWRAAITVGIGDDDTVSGVAESDHAGEQNALEWVERELPRAEFPAWVARRPHGVAGAFLYGSITLGSLTTTGPEPS